MFRRTILQSPCLFSRGLSSSATTSSTKSLATPLRWQSPSQSQFYFRPAIAGKRFQSTEAGTGTEKETTAQKTGEGATATTTTTTTGTTDAAKSESVNGNGNGSGKAMETGAAAAGVAEEMARLKAELEAKAKEALEYKDKFLRSVADFRNLQDRTTREVKNSKDFAIQKFAKDLVETVDTMEIALTAVPEVVRSDRENHKDLVDLYNGLKMTEKIFLSTLERHGLKKVVPEVGERFDPNVHEATFQAPPTKEGMEAGTVMHVMRSGFLLHGRVLRAPQVGVVKAP